ncbi:MAG TPA: metal-dependent transcriptional regulator [Candidatus Thalassarchaeaceae archaeon]|nr:metal-dependent transcriptional regulator [Candidatus Thalassarchaeaceae archaeon]
MKFSEYEQMYLKRIFEVHDETPDAIVKTTQLAQIMGVSPASATEMVQRLSEREMVTHVPYRGFRLTPEGFQFAARIKRIEGLLQILLVDIIGFSGDFTAVASKMEHAVSEDLEVALDKFLGYPEHTYDGDKIPSIDRSIGSIGVGTLLPLSSLPDGASAMIELIVTNSVEVVTISDSGLSIGTIIYNNDGTLYSGDTQVSLSSGLSKMVLARVTNT